ncbi:hypothetical protein BH23ACT3_BH23ACT3_19660 [soil metagenome]
MNGSVIQPPLLDHRDHDQPSVFTAAALLREARRQQQLPHEPVPPACLLDPDGDIAGHLIATGQADWSTSWACYHSRMLLATIGGHHVGVIPRVVGGPYAVLVAEQLVASGCQLLLSVTSAGQLAPVASPPYFVLITTAIRDEGTSYHYLPPGEPARLDAALEQDLADLNPPGVQLRTGASWTTDAPFRETQNDIDRHTHDGLAAVEMEAASLYAFATATRNKVVCFAHVTNQMASIDHDFEKGAHNGAADALTIITSTLDLLNPEHQ